MRKAEQLSTTTAPAFTASRRIMLGDAAAGREQGDVHALEGIFGQFLDDELLAAERLRSCRPSRAEASSFERIQRRVPRLSMQPTNSRPTAPVAPTIATFSVLHLSCSLLLQAIKKAPSGFGGAWVFRVFACFSRARRAQARHGLGLGRLVLVLARRRHGREPMGRAQVLRQRL